MDDAVTGLPPGHMRFTSVDEAIAMIGELERWLDHRPNLAGMRALMDFARRLNGEVAATSAELERLKALVGKERTRYHLAREGGLPR